MPEHLFARFSEGHDEFANSSVMVGNIRAFDWSRSSAGPIYMWPEELKSAVRLILLSAAPMAVLIGREGLVVQNDALQEMLGERYATALGQPITKALPVAASFFRDAISSCYDGKGVRFRDQPVKLLRGRQLETAWFSLALTPIADTRAHIYGVLVVASETTERMRALKALERSQQRMELALDAGGIVGTWDLDVRSNRVTTSGSFAALFGVSQEESRRGVRVDMLSTSVHPQDRDRVFEGLRAAIMSGSDYRCHYRAVTSKGDTRWFIVSGRPVCDDRGRIVQFAGVVIDTTEQSEMAAALEQSNLRFDLLAESIPQIIWSADADGRHDYFNGRWTEFTGIAPENIQPTTWQELVHPDDRDRVAETWQECLKTGKTYDIDYRFRYHDGSYRWLWVVALPLRNADGEIIRWYGTSSDIDAPKQLEEQREMVSQELDHRIKNLFALVNGLIAVSVREQPEHRPLAETLRARLDALHRAHGLIRAGIKQNSASLRGLLEQLLTPYMGGSDNRITIDGLDVTIDAGVATSVALVFHELITNAAKYGALSRAAGALHVTVSTDGDHQIIEWNEKFGGGVNGEAGEGFGSRLIKTMVEDQLRGRITSDLSTKGLTTRIAIPRSIFVSPAGQ
ncbi:sensor histidine kinase [Brucella anthropi]|uniref:sensor histidine kinase n=1 Tax=Brucella anthropi TaxID=529 RepID=UPI00178C4C3D|nr:PAS domain-containing protein [Brucella anthropi]